MTDDNILTRLAAYYEVKGIAPNDFPDFRCRHKKACSAGSLQFTTTKASFVGPEYAKGNGPRLLFLSLDSGSAETDWRRRTIEAVQHDELREDVGALHKGKHWYLTHELAWVLLRHFHRLVSGEAHSTRRSISWDRANTCLGVAGRTERDYQIGHQSRPRQTNRVATRSCDPAPPIRVRDG